MSERARLINEAFASYYVPLHVTEDQVSRMDQAYDVDLTRSVVALVGAEAVGLTLLGRRGTRGWIHSVGTLPAWRRCGIARAMVAQVICMAGEAGVEELLLEVFLQNAPAHGLYASLGFQPRRELLSWHRSADEIPLPCPRESLVPARPATLYALIASWQAESRPVGWDERPCWQREVESLRRLESTLEGFWLPADGAEIARAARQGWAPFDRDHDARVDGCCLVSENDELISIMAASIRPGIDALTRGEMLLRSLSSRYRGHAMSMLNVPGDGSLCRILAALGFTATTRQMEMVLYLL
jgi:ribosomal protein S18 acetylase RimI-like enzyme